MFYAFFTGSRIYGHDRIKNVYDIDEILRDPKFDGQKSSDVDLVILGSNQVNMAIFRKLFADTSVPFDGDADDAWQAEENGYGPIYATLPNGIRVNLIFVGIGEFLRWRLARDILIHCAPVPKEEAKRVHKECKAYSWAQYLAKRLMTPAAEVPVLKIPSTY